MVHTMNILIKIIRFGYHLIFLEAIDILKLFLYFYIFTHQVHYNIIYHINDRKLANYISTKT